MNCILCIPFIIKVNKSITWWPPCNPYTKHKHVNQINNNLPNKDSRRLNINTTS
uniref:Serine/arginine-rich splicing factor RSZ22A-like isoform X2 n=1 Tax=Rhizophora mucronata TaxID=61149 RepID=A0A2P2JN72_RHIMU